MAKTIQVVTPENVTVTYELAGIGSRGLAIMLDTVLEGIIVLIVLLAGTGVAYISQSVMVRITGMVILWVVLVFIWVIYPIIFEIVWDGRTPGKRLAGLRVIREGGYPINGTSAIIRNLARFIDFLPIFYGVGIITMFVQPEYKRLGDIIAGTIVIREPVAGEILLAAREEPIEEDLAVGLPDIRNLDRLTSEDYQALRSFVQRQGQLKPPIQERLAGQILQALSPKLDIPTEPLSAQDQIRMVQVLERAYAEEHRVL